LRARRLLAYALIAIFTLLPYIPIHGKPAILLNVVEREFTLFGFTFLPTDTMLLALLLVTFIVGICLATALMGRVWCGWMCPQTVYLEFVYRPLERLLDGPPGAGHRCGRRVTPLRTAIKFVLYAVVSVYLAHTFLAYFVGVEALAGWVRSSPVHHPLAFLLVLGVSGLMLFDFGYFREQTCIVACPYGRFQSVMLDRDSLIVSYDYRRGEPRGRRGRHAGQNKSGDCIDCGLCTDTCPTGIDIRDGLQMECVACTQCIDACDQVMVRAGKPRGLIRFSSQSRIEGTPARLLRPRVVLYPAILLVLVSVLTVALVRKPSADVMLLRGLGAPFIELVPGEITNQLRVRITNRGRADAAYKLEVTGQLPARITANENPVAVAAGKSRTVALLITLPAAAFHNGQLDLPLQISDGHEYRQALRYRVLGPQ
jgi:cytochrome c oxidase accessory protein FixG